MGRTSILSLYHSLGSLFLPFESSRSHSGISHVDIVITNVLVQYKEHLKTSVELRNKLFAAARREGRYIEKDPKRSFCGFEELVVLTELLPWQRAGSRRKRR